MTRRDGPGRPPHPDVLTPAEWRVAEAVRHGLANRDIAERLGVSTDAVKFHVANVLSKLGLCDRRALRLWSGVRTDSELSKGTPMSSASSANLGAIGQVARTVSDVESATTWYRDVLGLPHLFSFGKLAFFDCGGVRLLLSEGDLAQQSILYFRVGDIREAQARLESRKVTFTHAPHRIHVHDDGSEEWMAFFADLDGRPLGLMACVPAR